MSAPPTADPAAALAFRRARRAPWRRLLALFLFALTLATHWPALTLGPAVPASDKTIHLVAFGLLAWLLLRARPPGGIAAAAILAILWATLDEWTQGIPGIDRHVTGLDLAANIAGITIVIAWAIALRPLGGCASRARRAAVGVAFDRILARRRDEATVAGLFGAMVAVFLVGRYVLDDPALGRFLIQMGGGTLAAIIMVWGLRRWRDELDRLARDRRCIACGAVGALPPGVGSGACPTCGAAALGAQWSPEAGASPRILLRVAARPILFALVALAVVLILAAIGPRVGAAMTEMGGAPRRLAREVATAPPSLARAADLTLVLIIGAVFVGGFRRAVAAYRDAGNRCVGCGHDLRGTPARGGAGRCGECGAAFIRAEATEA